MEPANGGDTPPFFINISGWDKESLFPRLLRVALDPTGICAVLDAVLNTVDHAVGNAGFIDVWIAVLIVIEET